jgi:ABC-type lipoprotein export system ATPase subunit
MITLDALSFGYKDEEPIFTDLDWQFEPGSTTAVTGVSGQGKSTLLYLIGLLLTPWSGSIRHRGDDLTQWRDRGRSAWRASQVGFVFQDAALDPTRTIIDNIVESSNYNQISRRIARRSAMELMERFGVELRADHKPGEVSGGQAQRIALCRALLSSPELILADEPTGNLDTGSANVVIESLVSAAGEGRTVIVASHDQAIVDRCDQVLQL